MLYIENRLHRLGQTAPLRLAQQSKAVVMNSLFIEVRNMPELILESLPSASVLPAAVIATSDPHVWTLFLRLRREPPAALRDSRRWDTRSQSCPRRNHCRVRTGCPASGWH